ncbi:hypothetical protein SK128_008049, partial [Halocaridina rubra]
MESSQGREKKISFPGNTLELAMKQAQIVIQNLSYAKKPLVAYDKSSQFAFLNINNVKENYDVDAELIGKISVNSYCRAEAENVLKKNIGNLIENSDNGTSCNSIDMEDDDPENSGEYIANQIKTHKEEFWASLVSHGYLKPQELSNGATAATEAVQLTLNEKSIKDTPQESQALPKDVEKYDMKIGKKKAEVKFCDKNSGNPGYRCGNHNKNDVCQSFSSVENKDEAVTEKRQEDKATLVTSLMSTYSDADPDESEYISQSSMIVTDVANSQKSSSASEESSGKTDRRSNEVLSSSTEKNVCDHSETIENKS